MSLIAIENYVNSMISSNRKKDHFEISTYFDLMNKRANEILIQLQAAKELKSLPLINFKDECNPDKETFLSVEEREVIKTAVAYILDNTQDICNSLDIINSTGLLDDVTNEYSENRYHFIYKIEIMLSHASELYYQNMNWWNTLVNRNKPRTHFNDLFFKDNETEGRVYTQPQFA